MKNLKAIIGKLNRGERKIVADYCEFRLLNQEEKKYLLIKYLLEYESDNYILRKLYNGKSGQAFSHLKNEAKEEILSLLLLQSEKGKFRSPINKARYKCKKYFLFAQILHNKGLYNDAKKYVNKIIKIADKYELLLDKIVSYDYLKHIEGITKGIKNYQDYSNSSQQLIELYKNLSQAYDLSNEIILPITNKGSKAKSPTLDEQPSIDILKALFEKTQAAQIGFLYYKTAVTAYYYHRESEKAKAIAQEFLAFIQLEPSLATETNIGGINMQLASVCLNLNQYSQALEYAQRAYNIFKPGLINHLYAMESLFFSYLRINEWTKSAQLVEQALKHQKIKVNKILPAKWYFYQTCLFFLNKDYEKAFQTLREAQYLMFDRSGWQFGYRIMEIIILYESFGSEYTDLLINNFNKLLLRQKEASIKRPKLITHILSALLRYNFDFKLVSQNYQAKLDLLRVGQGDYYWNPYGYEVIRFDVWFDEH